MRIRKNAKISPLIYAASSLKPGTVLTAYDCKLNQSPWDVLTFSTSELLPPTVDKNVANKPNAVSSGDLGDKGRTKKTSDMSSQEVNPFTFSKNGDEKMPYNSSTKERKSKGSHIRAEYKSNQYKDSVVKRGKLVETRRVKRDASLICSNPYESYYYYSGFGPKWGKKRGLTSILPIQDAVFDMETSLSLSSQICVESFNTEENGKQKHIEGEGINMV